MGWWVMSEVNLQQVMESFYANAYGRTEEEQIAWWNSLTEEEQALIVDRVGKIVSEFLGVFAALSTTLLDLNNAMVSWYNGLDPDVKRVIDNIAVGGGVDALRK